MIESQPPLSPVPGQTSPNLQVDSALLTDRFKPSLKSDYAGCGYFDPFEHTIGKQADETDKAFYYWKKCVQYASYVGGTTHSRTINKSCRSSIHIYRESTVKKMLVQIRVLLNYWLERIQILIFLAIFELSKNDLLEVVEDQKVIYLDAEPKSKADGSEIQDLSKVK